MRTIIDKDYLLTVANTAWQQILMGAGVNVAMSWGIETISAMERKGSDNETVRPCLALKVGGLIHTGWVIVALDELKDTYEILLIKTDGTQGEWITDVYCDELGARIDALVERPLGMSDDEYFEKAMADSEKKCNEYYEEV